MQTEYVLRDIAPPRLRAPVQDSSDEALDPPHRRGRQARHAGALRAPQRAGVPFHPAHDRQPVAGRGSRRARCSWTSGGRRRISNRSRRSRPGCSQSPATRRCPLCAGGTTSTSTTRWRHASRIPPTTRSPLSASRTATASSRSASPELSSAHREVIDLVYYHEKSVDEVAQIVGVPPATVKTRMFYARNKMADLLRQAGRQRALS